MPPAPVTELSNAKIREALSAFGVSVSDDQAAQIGMYTSMLLKWNRTMSLTTVRDPLEVVRRHFGESMFAAKCLPVEKCRLADVGTGAGFPGLALKIARPDIFLMLIESNHKKCAFLSEIVRTLDLADVQVVSDRFEEIRADELSLSVVTSRAVGEFKELLRWSKAALVPGGQVLLWVGADDATRILRDGNWVWEPPTRFPDSQRRYLLSGCLRANDAGATPKQ